MFLATVHLKMTGRIGHGNGRHPRAGRLGFNLLDSSGWIPYFFAEGPNAERFAPIAE